MRKSFTLLFSTLILLCAFGFSSFAVAPGLATTDPLSPANGANNVNPTTANLVVNFNQDVKFTATGGTLWIMIGTTTVKTVALEAGSANATISGKKLTVKHGLTLTNGTTYKVGITNNAIENVAEEKFAGIPVDNWSFTIGDYTAPVVGTLSPADNAANVDVTVNPFNLVITFTDVNNIVSVPGKKIWLYRADGTVVDIITIDGTNPTVAGKTATIQINPSAFRDELTEYYVQIEAGAFTDASTNLNKFAGILNNTSWSFSSRDYSAPFLTASTITNISYSSATLNVTANEAGSVWYKVQPKADAAPTHPGIDATGWTEKALGSGNSTTASLTGLDDGVEYTVYIVAQNEEDELQTNASKVDFTTLDNTAPLVTARDIVNEDNVTVGVELTFNEEVEAGTGNLLIKRQSNNETVRTVAAEDVLIEEDEDNDTWIVTVRFDGLESAVGYYVIIPSGYIEDVAGNDYVSTIVTTTEWLFTSGDFVVPTVVIALDESDPPLATDNIEIDFSEEVKLVDGVSMAGLSSNVDWFNYIALEKDNVVVPFTASYSGSVITINPTVNLEPNSTYVVKIRANAFEDLSDNAFSTVHYTDDVVTGDFGEADITYAPADGASAVAQGTEPTITFSKEALVSGTTPAAITAANIKASITFKKTDAAGANVPFTVEWDAATLTITVVPDAALESEGVYYLAFDYTDIEDVNGEAFDDPLTSTFTMIDYVAPAVTFSHSGTVDDMDSDDPLTLTFSEAVTLTDVVEDVVVFKEDDADGANLGFTASMTGNVITIVPAVNLEDGAVYYYGIGAGAASDGVNENAAAFSTFTFEPAVPDMLEVAEDGLVPAHEATGVKVNAGGDLVAVVTFTEDAKANPTMPLASNATLYDSNDAVVKQVAIVAGDFEGDELTITFEDVALTSEGEYYITIDANVAVANDDNDKTFAGIAAEEWTFTAADILKPILTADAPVNGATGVALNAAVVIGVNEDVVAGTGNITIAAGTADVKTVAVADAVIDNTAGTITVPHAAFTRYNTVYTVTVPAGAFKDDAGNANDAMAAWTFTTVVNPAPYIVSLDPADEEDLVAAGTENFVMEFSEPVQKGASGTVAFLFEKGTGATRAVLNGDGTATANSDTQVGAILVTSTNVQVAGNLVTLNFEGFELVDGKEYYILVESGMFKDLSAPATADFAGITSYDADANEGWNFFTKDVKAPTWTVSYTERGEGMDVTSDIVITFSKPIEKTAGTEISNADVATLFTLSVGGTTIAFTGNINADKTVVVLENESFIPALTTGDSGETVSVAPTTGIRGKVNQKTVSTTAVTFPISDYDEPTVTLVAGAVEGEEFDFDVSSNEAGTIYWIVMEGEEATMTAEDVMVGTAIEDYTSGPETVTVDTDIMSETTYTVYAVAVDETGNVSDVDALEITTDDITKPVVESKTNTFATGGVLSLLFSEDVVPNGAEAVIRLAGSLEIIDRVPLTATAEDDSLILTSATAWGYPDNQQFVIEIAGGVVADVSPNANKWDGQIGLGANAWIVGLPDRTKPILTEVAPDLDELVGLDAAFTLTFNENIKLAEEWTIGIYYINAGVQEQFEMMELNDLTVKGNVLTINPSRTFLPESRYEIFITADDVVDMAGNAFLWQKDEVTQLTYFSQRFWTVDNVAPTATFDPADGETDFSQTLDLTITFDEAIILRDGSVIDNFDLDSVVYLTKGGVAVAHEATIAGNVITINPAASLEQGVEYTYGFTADFMDASENEVDAEEASFTVVTDEVVATYIEFDPDNNLPAEPTVVPVDQSFRIIFSGKLYTYSTTASENNVAVTPTWLENSITLIDEDDDDVPFSVSIESWEDDETVIVVTPDDELESEFEYVLSVLGNRLQIGVGNETIITDGESNDYMTEDALAPTAVTFVPADGGSSSATATMSIAFSEDVMIGSGVIKIHHEHGEVVLEINASELTVEDNLVEITTLEELEVGMEYYVIIPSGVITDLSGNAWAGIDEEDEWNFTISEDNAAPQIVNIAPVGGNVPVNSSLVITFDRPVELNGTEGYIAIYTTNGVAVQLVRVNDGAGLFTFNGDNTEVTVDINDLAQNTRFEVEVAAGTFVLEADNTLENEGVVRSIWTFTTEINAPPVIVTLTPADGAEAVSLRTVARMVFDIDVQAGTGEITLRRGVDASVVHAFDVNSDEVTFNGKVVTFSLEGLLEANNTDYYIIVPEGAITNISSVPEPFAGLEQTTSWNFTTQEDGVAPELITWSPDEIEIDSNQPVFVMEFSENVVLANDGNLTVTEVGSDEPALVIPLTEDMFVDSIVTVTYDSRTMGELKYETEYFVTVDGGVIEDMVENVWEGVSDITVWTFFTKDLNVTISEVQGTGNSSPMMGELVKVTGTITAISANEGFFMQDANGAWSGIWVVYNDVSSLSIGDGVVVVGSVSEPAQVTAISASEVTVVDAPLVVVPVDVNSPSDAKTEMYESVMVQVNGARATAANDNGVWNIYYETFDVVAVNKWFYEYAVVEGHFYNVAGVVNARLGNFRLEPRMESDIYDITVETSVPGVSAVDFKVYPNPFNNFINIDNSDRLTRVVITNIAGQRVMDVNYPGREIRTANLVSGVYVISLFTEDGMVKSDRIVKR